MIHKKLLGGALLFAAGLAFSCARTEETGVEGESVSLHLVSASGEFSKTWLDLSGGGATLPVYWSDGDRVSVNGVGSSALSIGWGEKVSEADFKVRNVEAPFHLLYPAESCSSYSAGGVMGVRIPDHQAWEGSSFACRSALLYGYAENAEQRIELKNLCGAVRVTLKDALGLNVIQALTLTSLGSEPISGDFSLDVKSGALTAVSGSGVLTMDFPEGGVTLTPDGQDFIFAVPAGTYPSGFGLRFVDAARRVLKCYWLRAAEGAEAGVTLRPGALVSFEAMEYVPGAREITSAEDWSDFAAACNAGDLSEWTDKNGVVSITADFTAASLTPLANFDAILDGGGHTVTQTAGTLPLVTNLSGTVRNLTLAGANTPADPGNLGAAVFASVLQAGGCIENCVNKTNITRSSSEKTVGGAFVRSMSGGRILNCVNEGNINLKVDVSSGGMSFEAGGLVGTFVKPAEPGLISGCVNRGSIICTQVKPANVEKSSNYQGYGGIIGTVIDGKADNYLTIENCTNEADVTVTYNIAPTSIFAAISGTGGILGMAVTLTSDGARPWYYNPSTAPTPANEDCVYLVMKNCINRGTIHSDLASRCSSNDAHKGFTAGIAGVLNGRKDEPILVQGCENYGKVIPHEFTYSRSALSACAGGLCGMAAYVEFKDCIVKSEQIGTLKRQNYSTAGAIAYPIATFKMENCKIFANILHINTTRYTDGNFALGFSLSTRAGGDGGTTTGILKLDGSSITGCAFGGTLNFNSSLIAYDSKTAPTIDKKEETTASTFDKYIASSSFFVDAEKKGIPSMVTIENNSYWDGN